jgi:hypothetical protein
MTAPNKEFGSRKFQDYGLGREIEEFPERKIITYDDFAGGYTSGVQRHRTEPIASPNTQDFMVRTDGRLQRVPGTKLVHDFGPRIPTDLALHPNLNSIVQLVLVAPPEVGFWRQPPAPPYDEYEEVEQESWFDLGFADRGEFASTVFGGTLIFTDGIRAWSRNAHGGEPKLREGIPAARSYASFAARVFAGGTLIDGRFEPLGIRWIGAAGNY